MKVAATLLILAALTVGGYFAWQKFKPQNAADAEIGRESTAVVEQRDISFSVNVAGEIAPAEQVSVRPEINGRIASMAVDIGDKVKKGQVLFTLDDQELQSQRSTSMTEIDRAKLQLSQSQRNFGRNSELFEAGLISQEIFETSKTDFALASNAVERASKELLVIDERLTKTQINAPFDCTVLTRPVSVGQAVAGSGGMSGGTEVLTVADLHEMVINAHVNQVDVTRLKAGQEVLVQIEAVPGLRVTGVVDRVAPQATVKNNVKGFSARIAIRNADTRIQPGMTANVTIPVQSIDSVTAVKLGAVFTDIDPTTGTIDRYVYVMKGEEIERRPVRIGLADYFYAQVESGLQVGEVVLIEPPPQAVIDRTAEEARAAATRSTQPTAGTSQPAAVVTPKPNSGAGT
jgi:HlyD family secretion protein